MAPGMVRISTLKVLFFVGPSAPFVSQVFDRRAKRKKKNLSPNPAQIRGALFLKSLPLRESVHTAGPLVYGLYSCIST